MAYKIWDVNIDNIVISKRKNNSKYLIGYLDKVIKPLLLIFPKMSGYVETFRGKSGDKNQNSKLISLGIDDNNLLKKFETISTKIEDLKNIKLDALPVYYDRYIKTNIRK